MPAEAPARRNRTAREVARRIGTSERTVRRIIAEPRADFETRTRARQDPAHILMNTRPSWTITRAATECGVSRDTTKRRRAAGEFPNTHQDQQGRWLIPIDDLIAAGLRPRTPTPPDPAPPGMPQGRPRTHHRAAPANTAPPPPTRNRTEAPPNSRTKRR